MISHFFHNRLFKRQANNATRMGEKKLPELKNARKSAGIVTSLSNVKLLDILNLLAHLLDQYLELNSGFRDVGINRF